MTFPEDLILNELARCKAEWVELTPDEHLSCLDVWMESFGQINSDKIRIKSGPRAITEAEQAYTGSYLLVPCRNPGKPEWESVGIAYRCVSKTLPDLTEVSHHVDVFISPEDFDWTLYYGHEVDVFVGPRFTMRDWNPKDLTMPSSETLDR